MSNNEPFFLEFDFFRINPYGQWQKYYFIELRGATLDSLHTHFASDFSGRNDEETVSVRYQYVRSCHLIANTEQRELILPSQYDRLFSNKNPIVAQRNAAVAAGLAVGRGAVAGQTARSALSAAASRIPPINPLTAGVMGMLYSSEVGKGSDIIPPEYKHSIEDKAPNLGAVLSDSVKQELGGVGAGTPGGWGPEDEENARIIESQRVAAVDELVKVFDKSHPANTLKIDGQTIKQGAGSNSYGTTKIFETQNLSDKQIYNYAQQLAGSSPLKETRPGIYVSKLTDNSTVTLRNVSSSQTGARWTIDIKGNQRLRQLGHKYKDIEIKFR